jgi:hypothetical protein
MGLRLHRDGHARSLSRGQGLRRVYGGAWALTRQRVVDCCSGSPLWAPSDTAWYTRAYLMTVPQQAPEALLQRQPSLPQTPHGTRVRT